MIRLYSLLIALFFPLFLLAQNEQYVELELPDSLVLVPLDSVDDDLLDSLIVDSLALDSLASDSLQFFLNVDTTLRDTVVYEVLPVKVITVDPLDTITQAYLARIQQAVLKRDTFVAQDNVSRLDPYQIHLLLPPTYYPAAMHESLTTAKDTRLDHKTMLIRAIHRHLTQTYVQYPWLVRQTEQDLKNAGTLRNDITEHTLQNNNKLAEKLPEVDITPEVQDTLIVVTRRPNFWRTNGSASLQFSQSYFTKNWAGGGENAYAGNSSLNLSANFNNQRKITWNNSFSATIGFQTSKNDTRRAFRPTNNNMRFNTQLGYQLWKSISYSTGVQMSTGIVPVYDMNSDNCTSDVLTPLDITISVGLNYGFGKGKFSGSVSFAPVAYSIRYVSRAELATRYGILSGHQSSHQWGPNLNFNATWNIAKGLSWRTRIYWFSNLKLTRIEWENNFNFQLNQYISAQLTVYPKFDDSAPQFKNEGGKYIMMREGLSIGMNYNF